MPRTLEATQVLVGPKLLLPGPPSTRAASPVVSFEELARILAEEWDSMPEEAKTPYRQRADEEHLRHETMSAALALTQIGTPSFPSGPTTPVLPPGKKARRCLDIGTPNWQSPRLPPQDVWDSPLGHGGCGFVPNLAGLPAADDPAGLLSEGGAANNGNGNATAAPPSSTATPSRLPPWSPPPFSFSSPPKSLSHRSSDVVRRRDDAGAVADDAAAEDRRTRARSSASAPHSAAVAPAGGGAVEATPENVGDGHRNAGWPMGLVGLTVHPAAGTVAAVDKDGGCQSPETISRTALQGEASKKSAAGEKRKTSSLSSSSTSAAAAASPWSISKKLLEERARKAEYKAGRELVSKMSRKDSARPKGPQSSYIVFYTEKMASFKAARPGMSITDIATAVGEAWRRLSDEMKLPYTKKAEADRKRYEDQLRAIARSAATSAATTTTGAAPTATIAPTSFLRNV
ncbi:conserved unknown protein [Ectocarpus siliculosus]|uniref:HMG box domain-containing protein n=1 Tax=Ectocarpus siliculosus TaxID=2880 RepID=D7FN78_ECTSI|nr:conserved unknown protein [Ectocarpus siliculosus]|eukprot:CBJ30135.1 conserved unknown protein [Ectocarpus siliculosus]